MGVFQSRVKFYASHTLLIERSVLILSSALLVGRSGKYAESSNVIKRLIDRLIRSAQA